MAREFLKRENLKLPPNNRLYDLLAQSEVVEANGDRQCVRRIKVPGKHGPVELSALIFHPAIIIPERIFSTLPTVAFELVPEEPKPTGRKSERQHKPSVVEEHDAETATDTADAGDPFG